MRFIILLFLALAAVSYCKKDKGLQGVKSGSWAGSKMQSLQVRSAVFTGGSGWRQYGVATGTTYTSYPGNTYFNISRSPAPAFIASSATATNLALKGTYTDGSSTNLPNYYQKVSTTMNFAVMQNSANEIKDFGHMMTASSTIKIQRTNYYMCAYQKYSSSSVVTFKFTEKGCAEWTIDEYNENHYGLNKTITVGSFGSVHLYFNYIHNTYNSMLPKYVTEITVNKITAFTNPTGNKWTTKTFYASMGGLSTTWSGSTGHSWSGGFALNTGAVGGKPLSPMNVATVSANDATLTVMLLEKLTYSGGSVFSTANYWSQGQSQISSQTFSPLNYCDLDNQKLQSGAYEVDISVKCSSGYIVKFALAMVAMVAGLLML